MSRQRALKTINLEPTDKIAEMELIEDPRIVQEISGIDPYAECLTAFAETYKALDIDIIWPHTLPESLPEEDGSWGIHSGPPVHDVPFKTTKDVLGFDPFEWIRRRYHLEPSSRHLVDDIAEKENVAWEKRQILLGDSAIVVGTWGLTLFHYLANTFGTEMSCIAAKEDPAGFKQLLGRFAEVSSIVIKAWSLLPLDLFISHDDLAWQRGTVFAPDWYREYIIPWYRELWQPIKEKGVKLLFWSDGDYSELIDGIVDSGADGFMVEPMIDLERMFKRYGGKVFILGNIDSRVLTFGGEEDIEGEIKRCAGAGRHYPGQILCATGSITNNTPLGNAEAYFELMSRYRERIIR